MEETIKLNLWGYIKYRMLRWLLNDLCRKSDCAECELASTNNHDVICPCVENDIFVQGRKVWGIE